MLLIQALSVQPIYCCSITVWSQVQTILDSGVLRGGWNYISLSPRAYAQRAWGTCAVKIRAKRYHGHLRIKNKTRRLTKSLSNWTRPSASHDTPSNQFRPDFTLDLCPQHLADPQHEINEKQILIINYRLCLLLAYIFIYVLFMFLVI